MGRSRRGRSEGSVFQRSDGKWAAEVSFGFDGAGKRKRKTVYGPSKAAVLDKLAQLRSDATTGSLPDTGGMTIGLLLDRWLAATKPNMAARTFEERERVITNHVRPRLGRVKLSALNALHVESLYADMRAAGVGGWTIRTSADLLSIALGYAVRLRLLRSNPAREIPKPKGPKREMVCMDPAQVRAVLGAAVGRHIGPLVTVALGTGCRQGELLALHWGDIDLKRCRVTIRMSLSHTKDGFALKEPKTAASRRTITLPPFAVEVLAALHESAKSAGMLAAPVFCSRTGGYLYRKNVLRAFRAVVLRANRAIADTDGAKPIPEAVRFHDCRHTVASVLLSAGESLKAVSARLGHAKPTMTLAVYAHCLPNDDDRLALIVG